ncbi:hypothetical protein AMTR_s00028p00129850 [Amborella trichopoda]|uniref:Uncharacterized protein n=1 Tax=Amborella trichopoda TaxID=13333 RepID=W1PRB5_AMBTC|nr:hypothetical protein AMTR_s00028p00129850 [Amborella trichopoda]
MTVSTALPPLSLSDHLGALTGGPRCFPLNDEAYLPSSHWPTFTPVILGLSSIQSLSRSGTARSGTALAARTETVIYPKISSQPLRLNVFRGEPASTGFEWNFTPNHNSSVDSSTSVGSDLHLVSPKLHPGHG